MSIPIQKLDTSAECAALYDELEKEVEQMRQILARRHTMSIQEVGTSAKCVALYNERSEYYREHPQVAVTYEDKLKMGHCKYPNFKNEVDQIRNLLKLLPRKQLPGGRRRKTKKGQKNQLKKSRCRKRPLGVPKTGYLKT
jgi:hypothetical protein